jgi:hypothetical protein
MPIPAYRAKQSTNTIGTGTIVLAAAETNARNFSAAYGASSRRVLYMIAWQTGYEMGLGDFDGGTPGNLTRATVLASSNAGALVTLPDGTKDVFAVFDPAAREVVAISGTATLALADLGNAVVFTGASAASLNLPAAATAPIGAGWLVMNSGTAALTIDPNGAELVNGAATLVLQAGASVLLTRNGAAWSAAVMIGPNVTGDLSVGGVLSASGAIRMQAGSAALPAITPAGDTNTGIFSPAADQLALSAGGVEVVRATATGVQSFQTLFLNNGGANSVVVTAGEGNIELIRGDGIPYIDFKSGNAEDFDCRIQQVSNGLDFLTGGDGSAVPRLRVTSDGSRSSVIPGGSTLLPEFQCRAWVNFNGTGTVAIRASGNVSSITDNGTGDYTVNFTTNMPDANYAVAGINGHTSGGGAVRLADNFAPTASSVRVNTLNNNGTGPIDVNFATIVVVR